MEQYLGTYNCHSKIDPSFNLIYEPVVQNFNNGSIYQGYW